MGRTPWKTRNWFITFIISNSLTYSENTGFSVVRNKLERLKG